MVRIADRRVKSVHVYYTSPRNKSLVTSVWNIIMLPTVVLFCYFACMLHAVLTIILLARLRLSTNCLATGYS